MLRLTTIMDSYSRKIVGRAMRNHLRADLPSYSVVRVQRWIIDYADLCIFARKGGEKDFIGNLSVSSRCAAPEVQERTVA
ncbi:hypothetical protein [Bradyrhizobium sp. SZCCHNPS1003]|uniref:hypothetical protein n=1 Tax=Bradyrhizobium sp. SZCCHNPS1003 TaxID=3057330 RepID=UPI0028ED0D67|nr:hypothetical protein [Bradyrhizobium sp. SZCCHNPS1003]